MTVKRLVEDENFMIVSWRNVLFRVGRGDADASHMETIHRHLEELATEYPQGIAFILWLYKDAPIPDSSGRGRATEMFKEMGEHLQGFGAVIEGRGFWASTIRSVLTGFTLMSRTRFPMKTFSTPHESVEWISTLLQPRSSVTELGQVIEEISQVLPP